MEVDYHSDSSSNSISVDSVSSSHIQNKPTYSRTINPVVIQRKINQLSSTLKETSQHLNRIDTVFGQYKSAGKSKDGTITQLKKDLKITLQRLNFNNEAKPTDTETILPSPVCNPHKNFDIDSISIEKSERRNYDSQVTKLIDHQFNADEADKKYYRMKTKARDIIAHWKQKYEVSEMERNQLKVLLDDVYALNTENNLVKEKLETKVNNLEKKIQTYQSQSEHIVNLKSQVGLLTEQHNSILQDVDIMREVSVQETLITKNFKSQMSQLEEKKVSSEKKVSLLLNENKEMKNKFVMLKEEKKKLELQCESLKSESSEKELAMNHETKENNELRERISKLENEKCKLNDEYRNILYQFNNQLESAIKCISRSSRRELKVLSTSLSSQHDFRFCIAETKSKLSWVLEELQEMSHSQKSFFPSNIPKANYED